MRDDSLTPDSITGGLNTEFIGRRMLYYPVISSTMDIARTEALAGAPEGTAIIAEQQSVGRGRLKRRWLTPPGNIAVSVILYPPREYINSLIMLASVSVLQSIRKVTGLECRLKWPNDVLIDRKKVCGILIETKAQVDTLDYAVLGIGINVNMRMSGQPDIEDTATSLGDELRKPVSRTSLLQALFMELENNYLGLKSGKSLYPAWRDNMVTIGKQVILSSGDEELEGFAESAVEDGSLFLRLPDKTLRRITIGDVSLREK